MTQIRRALFQIYHKKEGIYWTNTLIVHSIIISCCLILLVKHYILGLTEEGKIFDNVLFCLGLGSLAYGCIMKISGFGRYKPLKGRLEGLLILDLNKISIDNQVYNLDDIKKIEILNYDYYGKYNPERHSFEASLSRGVDNKFEITLNSGKTISCAFFQYNSNDMYDAKKHLMHYHLKEKIHFLHLTDILGITGYDKIEWFKREIEWFKEEQEKLKS